MGKRKPVKPLRYVAVEFPKAPPKHSPISPGHIDAGNGKSACGYPISIEYSGKVDNLRCSACYQTVGGVSRPSPFDVPRP